jgi:DNA repair protein SbcC/Rad50
LSQAEKLFEKKETLEKNIQTSRRNFEDLREKTQVYQSTKNNLVQDQAVLRSKIETLTTSLQYPEFCEPYFQKPIEHINADIEKVKSALLSLDVNLKKVKNELQIQRNLRSSIEGQNELLKSQIESLETKFLAAEKSLQEKLINSNFTLEEVNQLLKEKLDEVNTKKVIEEFENEMNFLSKTIADLEKNEEVTSFDPQVYQEHIGNHTDKNNAFESTKTKLALLEDEIKKYKEGLVIKSKLNVDLEKLETRLMKIRELESLFKGSGFVKYVSNIYLKELCRNS